MAETTNPDALFRISLKCLIKNEQGEVLVVQEQHRSFLDLPGGGIDKDEDLKTAISRELWEEAGYRGGFSYQPIHIEDPRALKREDIMQIRVIMAVTLDHHNFDTAPESSVVKFINPDELRESEDSYERRVYKYSLLA